MEDSYLDVSTVNTWLLIRDYLRKGHFKVEVIQWSDNNKSLQLHRKFLWTFHKEVFSIGVYFRATLELVDFGYAFLLLFGSRDRRL